MWREWKIIERVFEGNPGGRRKTGRPRKRWLGDIDGSEEMEEENNREVWAKIVWDIKALHGL
jgi:hypothetical protein